jgi:TPR repeat protein
MGFLRKFKINRLKKKLQKLYTERVEHGKGHLKEEIAAYFQLAQIYRKNKLYDPSGVYAMECYRAAAHLDDAQAQYLCAKWLMDKGRFWDKWAQGMFGSKIHHKYASDFFAEAIRYLIESEEQGHPIAKRLHGLAYIRGWGLPQNDEEGFKLIIASIDQENAWDRATKIFEELGLNTPEFFSKLVSHRTHQMNH